MKKKVVLALAALSLSACSLTPVSERELLEMYRSFNAPVELEHIEALEKLWSTAPQAVRKPQDTPCPSGKEPTPWCGCSPPVYGTDC